MEMTKKLEGRVFFFVLILLVGLALYFIFDRVFVSPEEKALRELKELEKAYQEDTYGGTTPEETLQLFIDALKTGDIELASKYFIIDEQEEWKANLKRTQNENLLNEMINDLNTAQRGKDISEVNTMFSVVNSKNEIIAVINIARGPNGIWKIVNL